MFHCNPNIGLLINPSTDAPIFGAVHMYFSDFALIGIGVLLGGLIVAFGFMVHCTIKRWR